MIRLPTRPNPWTAAFAASALASAGVSLLYDHPIGVGLPLFLAGTAAMASATNRVRIGGRGVTLAALALVLALLPAVETSGPLSALLGLGGLALYILAITGHLAMERPALRDALRYLVVGPAAVPGQIAGLVAQALGRRPLARTLAGWIIPLALGLVFVALFSAANPLIGAGLDAIPWRTLIPDLSPSLIAVWCALLLGLWPIVAFVPTPSAARGATMEQAEDARPAGAPAERVPILNPRTTLRSLVIFNLIFAVQSASDLAFLWAGASLPAGVSHASYAHQGAYPLVGAALLAGLFVLAALQPGTESERSPQIRGLVYLWIAQTILLVISAMLRLDLYVAVYALTYLRFAAFVWMGLVAIGLALIVARIVMRRSSTWLVGANAAALVLALYAVSFVNVGALIAETNVQHHLDSSTAAAFDLAYAMSVGPEAIPALDRYALAKGGMRFSIAEWRKRQVARHENSLRDWRGWTYRGHRLSAYLASHSEPPRAVNDLDPCRTGVCGETR